MIALLDRYRGPIESGLREALRGETSLDGILRYHVGLPDDGAEAPALGKLIRPSLVLFTAAQLGARIEDALPAAIGLELVHGFSLLHDDVQDGDEVRRGRPAAWVRWGTAEAINAGDLMHAIALRTALRAGAGVAGTLTAAVCDMIEGQSLDLAFEGRFVSEVDYGEMIDRKTGALFRCAFELGGYCAGVPETVLSALGQVGAEVGRAFQMQDDLLGIWGNGDEVGKPIGSDIRRKKKTYPVVIGHAASSGEARERLERIYASEDVGVDDVDWIVALFERLGVRERVAEGVVEHSDRARGAIDRLPFSGDGKRELCELIEGLTRRKK